jgi:ligand-binding SRPBCC domain-containing protein
MKLYCLERTSFLPVSITEAWRFVSSPENLSIVTPDYVKFKVSEISDGETILPGRVFRYKVSILNFINVSWISQISYMEAPFCFIDEQRSGPFSYWRHIHSFREVTGGVEVTDKVEYSLPFGIAGQLAHWLLVGRQLNSIFDYRVRVLSKHFAKQIRKPA